MCRFFRMGLLYYLVGVVPSSRLAPSYCYIIGCIPAQSFLCTWPAGQFNIGISPSMQAAHSLIWWSLNRSAQIQALHQRLPCRGLFRLPKKRSDCDCFFLLLGFTYTSPMLSVPWNDNGLFIFVGHFFHGLWWGHTTTSCAQENVAQTPRLYAEGGPQPSYGEKEAFNFTVLVPPGNTSSSCK